MNKCSLFDMTFSEIIEDIFGVSFDRLWELALADRERRCVVMPCQPGYKISYKSSVGLQCNAVIKDYTPENIFITAETEIPNAEPLSHTFSILEIEAALRREKGMKEYIERAVAVQELEVLRQEYEMHDDCDELVARRCRDALSAVPAADVAEVRHGHWVFKPGKIPYCSECKEYSDDGDKGATICPNCGAPMDKEDEHEAS